VTVKQAAKHLELSYKSVYRLIGQGDLACQRIGPGRGKIVLTEEHIREYRQSCECRGSVGVGR
jgi:excisionase family DNA binding protein